MNVTTMGCEIWFDAIALMHPHREWVRQFRQNSPVQILRGADRIDLDAVLPGFELTVEALFAALYAG